MAIKETIRAFGQSVMDQINELPNSFEFGILL